MERLCGFGEGVGLDFFLNPQGILFIKIVLLYMVLVMGKASKVFSSTFLFWSLGKKCHKQATISFFKASRNKPLLQEFCSLGGVTAACVYFLESLSESLER